MIAQILHPIFFFLIVRLRQEEKRQQEETNRVKERKRKREKYAEKVPLKLGVARTGGGREVLTEKASRYLACRLGYWLVSQLQLWVISSNSVLLHG